MYPRIERTLRDGCRAVLRAARLAVGVPDYEAYVRHVRTVHPEATPMSEAEFVRERLDARYARGRSRCC